jgi:type IV pilus assembly protein PilW
MKTYTSNSLSNFHHKQALNQQQGFTLVEIMIAITIGLLMVAGILQISSASKESSRLQRNMGFVQENIRSAMGLLGNDIRRAGYFPNILPNDNTVAIVAASTTDGGNANNDEITVSYEANNDCLGQNTPTVDGIRTAVNHYYISDERLMCKGNGNTAAQPLVEGVESMQILYGENTDGDPLSANRYVRPSQANLKNVVSVRIAMRFLSREGVRQGIDNNKYALLDSEPFQPADGDRHLRREITTTIALRNKYN